MTKRGYFLLAMKIIVVMTIVELFISFLVSNSEPNKATTWHYYAIFLNIMIAGGVFFKKRCMWEIKNNHLLSYSEDKTLADYLLHVSWIIVLLFFITFCLSFTGLWKIIIPDEFLHLFRWPALISSVIQGVLTIGSSFEKSSESNKYYKKKWGNYYNYDY